MEGLLLILFLGWLVNCVYNSGFASGKRLGSRKACDGVGYSRGCRQAAPSGCIIVVAAILALSGAAIVVAATCR